MLNPTTEIVVEVPDRSPQNFGVVTVEKNITYLKKNISHT